MHCLEVFAALSVFLATFCGTLSQAEFQLQDIPGPAPTYCKMLTGSGPCRATFRRYRFNADTNNCEMFTFGGCGSPKNLFTTREECMQMCYRKLQHQRAFGSTSQTCNFKVNLGRDCELKSGSGFRICGGLSPGQTEEKCRSRGCCRTDFGGVCYEKTSAGHTPVSTTCHVVYASNEGFYGKIVFQGDKFYERGWIGQLSFSKDVSGDFCLLRDSATPSGVNITESLQSRDLFFLKGNKPVNAGQVIVIHFSGTYMNSTFDQSLCDVINKAKRG